MENMLVMEGETNRTFNAIENGDYAVIVKQNSCIDTSNCYKVNTTNSYKVSGEVANNYIVYPNPSSERINISNINNDMERILISDTNGKIIIDLKIQKDLSIDISSLVKGIYFMNVITNNKTFSSKIVKY